MCLSLFTARYLLPWFGHLDPSLLQSSPAEAGGHGHPTEPYLIRRVISKNRRRAPWLETLSPSAARGHLISPCRCCSPVAAWTWVGGNFGESKAGRGEACLRVMLSHVLARQASPVGTKPWESGDHQVKPFPAAPRPPHACSISLGFSCFSILLLLFVS